jgi:hypothetical protein
LQQLVVAFSARSRLGFLDSWWLCRLRISELLVELVLRPCQGVRIHKGEGGVVVVAAAAVAGGEEGVGAVVVVVVEEVVSDGGILCGEQKS